MDVLFLLIPLSVLAMLAVLCVFAWALHGGQFEDIEAEGERILAAEGGPLDVHQAGGRPPPEQSMRPESTSTRRSA